MRRRNIIIGIVGLLVVIGVIGAIIGNNGGAPSNAGQVIFGSAVDTSAMKVTTTVTSVKAGTPLGWVAYFSAKVNGTSMTGTVARVGDGGAETTVLTEPINVADPNTNEWAHSPDTGLTSGQTPGTYKLRYVRSDGTLLAEGTIVITP